MNFVTHVPLFAYVLLAYNLLALMPESGASMLSDPLLSFNMISGAHISITGNGLFLIISVLMLYIEIVKSTRATAASVIDHAISMFVFVVFLIELIAVKALGTQTFLILTSMSLFDVIAGFTVTISSARRDIALDRNGF